MDLETLEALAFGDADAALARLVPGTVDADRFRVLGHQRRGELAAARAILDPWVTRHGGAEPWATLLRRQQVLEADADLAARGPTLGEALGLSFAHARELPHAPASHPSRWAQPPVEELVRAGIRHDRGLSHLTDLGVRRAPLETHRRAALPRLRRGGVPGLVAAIAKELGERDAVAFGGLPIHQELLLSELDALAELVPRLRTDREWVLARIVRQRPPPHVDLREPAARAAWVDALCGLVSGLPDTLGDLRVHACGHRLLCDRGADRTVLEHVLAYLALPRRASYLRRSWIEGLDTRSVAAQSVDLSRWTGLEALPDDAALVRHHVGRLLASGTPAAAFEAWVDGAWLREVEAEERVLAGDPDEAWSRRLGPAAVAALRERVELALPAHLPALFPRDAEVVLEVDAKNCWPLRVRVHRIDVPAAFAATGADVRSDLDLDGLVARVERVLDAEAPPAVRRRLRIPIPEIDRPGTWIVELLGGGLASRAVVRRGGLRAATRPTADGAAVTVLDEGGAPRPGAVVRVGTVDHAPDERGEVHLPFGTGMAVPALLVDGDLAVADRILLRAEAPELGLGVVLDHQALVPGAVATAVVRLTLAVGGAPAPIARLEDPFVEVVTVDRTGVPASRRLPVEPVDDADLAVSIPVPEHVAALRIAAGGRYRVASHQRHEALRVEHAVEVAGFLTTARTESVVRVPTPGGETLRVLGRTGEPVPGKALRVRLHTRLLVDPVEVALATDADGVVHLGPLPDGVAVEALLPDGAATFGVREPALPRGPTAACAGEPVRIPWRGDWRLVELRGGAPAASHPEHVLPGDGHLRLTLPAGRWRLEGDEGEAILDVLPAPRPADGAAVAVPLPDLVAWAPAPAPVLGVPEIVGDELCVRIHGPSAGTRVHVVATPAAPTPAGTGLSAAAPAWPARRSDLPRSAYLSGRDLGDELRYVIDRAALPRRPGSLLEKPSLLLSPWALRTTSTRVAAARAGEAWAAAPPPPAQAPAPVGRSSRLREEAEAEAGVLEEPGGSGSTPAWDFLAAPAAAVANLRPDADGLVRVPLAAVPGTVLEVHLVDPGGVARRQLVREPPARLPARDRRLAAALPDARHFAEVRALSAGPGGARAVRVDALEPVYRALCDLSGDPTLAAWDFLPRWRHLPREERLRLWNEHACHELALFVFHRDPGLFAALAPTLADKLEPGFVDDWLLRRPLDRWLAPWRFARLDVIERALLARARPDLRARVARGLADEVALRRPDRARDDRLVDALMGGSGESPPPPAEVEALAAELGGAPGGGGPMASRALDLALDDADEAPRRRAAPPKAKKEAAKRPQELWRPQDLTREWAEHQWHRTPRAGAGPGRVAPSRLWRDYAAHGEGPFLPASLADAADGFSAAVVALAVVGVEPHALVAEAALVAGDPPDGSVLVGQHLVRADDRYAWDGDQQREKPVGDELVTRVPYTGVVAVTNPTARHRRLGVLIQIPAGAIALGGALATRTLPVDLGPYATATLEVSFYFPADGTFAAYGCRVAEAGRVVAAAPGRALTVVRVPTAADAESWAWLSQEAPLDVLLEALGRLNLHRVDLGRLAWRMADRPAFEAITAALAARDAWHPELWGYALRHADRPRASELLDRLDGLAAQVAPLACGLLRAEPVDRGLAEHLEYAPLVNARAHRLGARREVLNDGLAAHWAAFLERLAARGGPTDAESLQLVQQLFGMDRADEAAARLAALPRPEPPPLQHAWLLAHAATLAGDLDAAARAVAPHLDHPVPRWRARFQAVQALVDEVRGGPPRSAGAEGRDARMSELAAAEPALSARIDAGELVLESANLAGVVLRVHPLDVEVLFSKEPFLSASADRFAVVEPADVRRIPLDAAGRTRVPLADHARANVALEVLAGPIRRVVTHFAHDLAVTVGSGYGQLQVRRASTGSPLSGAYVKVFARSRAGSVAFYKDGYTDLRGRFDHATLSTDDLDRTVRFALLVVHDAAGATVLEADPPTR